MPNQRKAIKYAKALFAVKGDLGEIQQREEDLEALSDLLTQFPKLLHFLSHPALTIEKKWELTERALKRKFNPPVKELISFLIKRREINEIRQTAAEYHKLAASSLQQIDAEVVSAEPLAPAEKRRLLQKLENKFLKKIQLIEKNDPHLLGGFTLLIQDQWIDLSVKGLLMSLKNRLLKEAL